MCISRTCLPRGDGRGGSGNRNASSTAARAVGSHVSSVQRCCEQSAGGLPSLLQRMPMGARLLALSDGDHGLTGSSFPVTVTDLGSYGRLRHQPEICFAK